MPSPPRAVSPTLGVRRRQEPQRGTSGGCWRSPARLCWGAGDRHGCPAFPCTARRHPRVHRPARRMPHPPVGRGRWRLTRARDTGGGRVAPPPGRTLPPGRAWRTARPAARTSATGPGRTPPHRARHAATPRAQAMVPPDHTETAPALTGTRRQCRGGAAEPTPARGRHPPRGGARAGATPTASHACGSPRRTRARARHHRSARGASRSPPGASSDAGPGPGWRGRSAQGAQVRSPGAVGHGQLVPRATPDSHAARSSPTPAVSRRAMY